MDQLQYAQNKLRSSKAKDRKVREKHMHQQSSGLITMLGQEHRMKPLIYRPHQRERSPSL